jgi:hypothetical protein
MKIKHKLLSDYQHLSTDKKIFILKSGTILENYNYKLKSENIQIDREIVDANPQLFQLIDWKTELLIYLKAEKVPQPSQVVKKLIPFIEEMILSSMQQQTSTDFDTIERRIKDKEEEIEVRSSRISKREEAHKIDIKSLDKKEDYLRKKS